MPNAGIDLRDWLLKDKKITKEKIFLLNELVMRLLREAVRPMNERGVIHNDLKDSNIMVDKSLNARIIDWGLAAVVKNNKVPDEILNRPLQFNTPFSSMILSKDFKINYNIFLERVKDGSVLFNKTNIRNYIVNEYLIKLARYYGYYDDNVILFNSIFSPAISEETFLSEVKRNDLIEYGYYLYYLSDYICDILMKYTNDNYEFNMDKYFSECYLFNSDVFGLMTVYYNFYQIKNENIQLNDDIKKIFLNRLRTILVESIYINGAEKINIDNIINKLSELNKIIDNTGNLSFNKFIQSKKELSPTSVAIITRSKNNNTTRSNNRSKLQSRSRTRKKSTRNIDSVVTKVT